jgi:hypothetical protein
MQTSEQIICEQATGCKGVGDYREWAEQQGYPLLEVFDWTSSAGDWTFIVSKGDDVWYVMWQENNWPRAGFDRGIDLNRPFFGTPERVMGEIYANC